MTLIPWRNINTLIGLLKYNASQMIYAHKQLREIAGGRGHTRGESCTGTLAPMRALPGASSMLTALAGNSKGERALTGVDSMAVPKSMVMDGPPLDMKVVTRKCDRGHKRLPGINRQMRSESFSASIPVLAWWPERVTSITRCNRYQGVDSAFTTGERTWCIRTDTSSGR